MHYYQFNIGDYAAHTKGLSLLEDLAYRRLMDEYYLAERPLNGCSTDVARLIGMIDNDAEVAYILGRYFKSVDGFYVHDAIENNILSYKNKSEKASVAGKASAKSRACNRRSTNVQQTMNVRSTNVQPTNNHKPITNNHEPVVITAQPESGKAVAIATAKTKGTRLTSDWQLPKASGEWALSEGFTREMVLFEADKFRDYWISKSGRDAVKLDWDATWRNWIRNSKTNIKKTFSEQKQDYLDGKAKKFYEPLLTMTDQERKEWGFQ